MFDPLDPVAYGHTPLDGIPDCLIPWYGMEISYAGFMKTSCCEYLGRPHRLAQGESADVAALFRGPWFEALRGAFARGDLHGSGCEKCVYQRPKALFRHPLEDFNPRQLANLEACLASYDAREPRVEHLPVRYSLCFTAACNLQCIMCSQSDSRAACRGIEIPAGFLDANRQALAVAASVFVSGGEPFVSGNCRDFLRAMCQDPLLEDVALEIVTNGQLLDSMQPCLDSKRTLSVHVSLDGVGETYEAVRRGGSWDRVRRNIDGFLERKHALGKDRWRMSSSCVLMRSSVAGLPGFIAFCRERGVEIVLQPLMRTRETSSEDLLSGAADPDDIRRALDAVEESLELLASEQDSSAGRHLRKFRAGLAQALEGAAKGPAPVQALEDSPADLGGRKVAIWGTGTNYQWCWADWLQQRLPDIRFLGFVDS